MNSFSFRTFLAILLSVGFSIGLAARENTINVASKSFTEGYIIGEILATFLESHGVRVKRMFGFQGPLAYQALVSGEVDIYPEYTGTITQTILKQGKQLSVDEINSKLEERGLQFIAPLGFENNYAIAVQSGVADRLNLLKIEDLKGHPEIKIGLTFEFLEREDGWRQLSSVYGLKSLKTVGMEHSLTYEALRSGEVQATAVYTTDAKILTYNLQLLNDNRSFFPSYKAGFLARKQLDSILVQLIEKLSGSLTESKMVQMNAAAENKEKNFHQLAVEFLTEVELMGDEKTTSKKRVWEKLPVYVLEHLYLTFIAIFLAILVAVPLAILLYHFNRYARSVMAFAGLLQTIPSLALLAFMIPLFGIGSRPAIVGLFLYSILPILRNTFTALDNINPVLIETAYGMGLEPFDVLRQVELPLALPYIVAGIRMAAVINIGTATIAAFIGAGGLGTPIVTGLALNDPVMILYGAVPAAVLAVLVELLFEALEHRLIPGRNGSSQQSAD